MMTVKALNTHHNTALYTDRYEISNVQSALVSGVAERKAVFELFSRGLPEGWRYGVVAGTERFLQALADFSFGQDQIDYLKEIGCGDENTWKWLLNRRFSGDIFGYKEGEAYFPYSPVLTLTGSFAECVMLETLALSIFNWDSSIASMASHMACAAKGKTLIEMASRRNHEEAAIATARAVYLAGFDSTSNLEAGRRYGVPTRGTVAHAFVMAHHNEIDAFKAQVAALGTNTTILVDTFDTAQGIRLAIEAAGTKLFGIRIDSGNRIETCHMARQLLNELGASGVKVILSGDVGIPEILEQRDGGADGFGVGTKLLGVSSGFVYKLVAIAETDGVDAPLIPRAKKSPGKKSAGGQKWAMRLTDSAGLAKAEITTTDHNRLEGLKGRKLQTQLVKAGKILPSPTLKESREFHRTVLAELGNSVYDSYFGEPTFTTEIIDLEEKASLEVC